jgi:hypothetical protein
MHMREDSWSWSFTVHRKSSGPSRVFTGSGSNTMIVALQVRATLSVLVSRSLGHSFDQHGRVYTQLVPKLYAPVQVINATTLDDRP